MNKQLICIICPKGCKVTVTETNGAYTTTGNACLRGNVYGIQEAIEPKRVLTSTVKIVDAVHQRCPVVSSAPIRKEDIFKVINILETLEVQAPILMNQVIYSNILQSGIDILASRTMVKQHDL